MRIVLLPDAVTWHSSQSIEDPDVPPQVLWMSLRDRERGDIKKEERKKKKKKKRTGFEKDRVERRKKKTFGGVSTLLSPHLSDLTLAPLFCINITPIRSMRERIYFLYEKSNDKNAMYM